MAEIRKRRLMGTHYVEHSIVVNGAIAHSQLSPYSDAEIAARVRDHVNPAAVRAWSLPELVPGSKARGSRGGQMKKGGRPKRTASVTETGFRWNIAEDDND